MGASRDIDEPVQAALDRVARAKEALRLAEERTGARTLRIVAEPRAGSPRPHLPDDAALTGVRTGAHTGAPASPRAGRAVVPPVASSSRSALSPSTDLSVEPSTDLSTALAPTERLVSGERPSLPVPPQLREILPEGLRRGSVTVVAGSTSLLLSLLAEASQAGSWGALVGAPSINLLAAAQAGVDLSRLVLVPGPGIDSAPAVAALLDGMDIVVVGPEVVLVDSDRRRLAARARERASVVLAMRPWQGASMTLTAERSQWSGLGVGHGRLRSRLLTVTRSGRAGAGVPLSRDLWLPLETSAAAPVAPAAPAPAASAAPAPVPAPVASPAPGSAPEPTPVLVPSPPDLFSFAQVG